MKRHCTSDSRFEIREHAADGSRALHTHTNFDPGQTLVHFSPQAILAEPSVHSIQLNASQHILLDPEFLRYTNHSCSPNVVFDVKRMVVCAIEPIRAGDEIVYYYPSTESSMSQPFSCFCKSTRCLGWIHGAAMTPASVLHQYHLAPHIQSLLEERRSIPLVADQLCKASVTDAR